MKTLMRFSIRDLLWATLVVGLCLAWWLEHQAYRETDAKYRETDAKRRAAVDQAESYREKARIARIDYLYLEHNIGGNVPVPTVRRVDCEP
jgi:hypothetical protein